MARVLQAGFSLFYHAPALVIVLATDGTTQSAEDCCLAAQYQVVAPIIVGHPEKWPEAPERKPPEINWLDS